MHIIREHKEENPSRICYVYETQSSEPTTPAEDALIAIDEDFLAWLYIAPGYEESERSRQLLDLARQLLGPQAWAVVAIAGRDQDMLSTMGLQVIESYENTAPASREISMHLTRTMQRS
jgi:hypothetical protein